MRDSPPTVPLDSGLLMWVQGGCSLSGQSRFVQYTGREETLLFPSQRWGEYGDSLVVQGLGISAFTAKGLGWTPCWGTKIP